MAKKNSKKEDKGIRIVVDKELIEILEKLQGKLLDITYGSMDKESYRKLSKILARKAIETGIVE